MIILTVVAYLIIGSITLIGLVTINAELDDQLVQVLIIALWPLVLVLMLLLGLAHSCYIIGTELNKKWKS